jgi:replicative DNA helicase
MSCAIFEDDPVADQFAELYPELATPEPKAVNLDAERKLLSFAFISLSSLDGVADYLKPEHFAEPLHGKVYAVLLAAFNRGAGDVDVLAVHDELRDEVTLAELHQISIQAEGVSLGRVASVGKLVFERARARQLWNASQEIAALAIGDGPIEQRIDAAQAALTGLQAHEPGGEWEDLYSGLIVHSELLERRQAGDVSGLPTGLHDLDNLLDGGMQRGNLVVFGARPGMGKSALGLTIALKAADRYSVGFFSLEMPHADVRDRITAILADMPLAEVKRPPDDFAWGRVVTVVERARELRLHVSDRSGLNILQVRARARALKRRHGLDVLVLDYIGLMPGTDPKMLRTYQVEEVTKGLKALAKEMDIVVIALAQVNRGVAERTDQTPMLSDLRDSGGIEQDADVVGFIHRPIVTKPDLVGEFASYGLLRIAKNRQGRIGDVHLTYRADRTEFADWFGDPPARAAAAATATRRRDDYD